MRSRLPIAARVAGAAHLAIAAAKIVACGTVVRAIWSTAFVSRRAAVALAILGIMLNLGLGLALLLRHRICTAACASVVASTFGVLCHAYVLGAGELVAAGCAARIVQPVNSHYHHVMLGVGVLVLALSAAVTTDRSR